MEANPTRPRTSRVLRIRSGRMGERRLSAARVASSASPGGFEPFRRHGITGILRDAEPRLTAAILDHGHARRDRLAGRLGVSLFDAGDTGEGLEGGAHGKGAG